MGGDENISPPLCDERDVLQGQLQLQQLHLQVFVCIARTVALPSTCLGLHCMSLWDGYYATISFPLCGVWYETICPPVADVCIHDLLSAHLI